MLIVDQFTLGQIVHCDFYEKNIAWGHTLSYGLELMNWRDAQESVDIIKGQGLCRDVHSACTM